MQKLFSLLAICTLTVLSMAACDSAVTSELTTTEVRDEHAAGHRATANEKGEVTIEAVPLEALPLSSAEVDASLFLPTETRNYSAKHDKDLVCHVANEVRVCDPSTGQDPNGVYCKDQFLFVDEYADDPDCVPSAENAYFCPDAGKVNLIEVANVAKHLGNTSHSADHTPFILNDPLTVDYLPTGDEGKADSDGDGIADSCDLPCPVFGEASDCVGKINTPIPFPTFCTDSEFTAFAQSCFNVCGDGTGTAFEGGGQGYCSPTNPV